MFFSSQADSRGGLTVCVPVACVVCCAVHGGGCGALQAAARRWAVGDAVARDHRVERTSRRAGRVAAVASHYSSILQQQHARPDGDAGLCRLLWLGSSFHSEFVEQSFGKRDPGDSSSLAPTESTLQSKQQARASPLRPQINSFLVTHSLHLSRQMRVLTPAATSLAVLHPRQLNAGSRLAPAACAGQFRFRNAAPAALSSGRTRRALRSTALVTAAAGRDEPEVAVFRFTLVSCRQL